MPIDAAILDWLLAPDLDYPSARYLTLRDLLHYPADDPQVRAGRRMVMQNGPVPIILAHQEPEGYWDKPGNGYAHKYTGSVWSLLFLAQLGADPSHPRVRLAGDYLLNHARSSVGGFSATNSPSGMIQCLQGNLCGALIDLGWWGDPRLAEAVDWLARSVTGDGVAPAHAKGEERRYYQSGNCGAGFACAANLHQPCAWGAVKALLALGKIPSGERSPIVQQAIEIGVQFLLQGRPALANYPTAYTDKPSQSWWQYGFPVFYVTDMLQNLEALLAVGVDRQTLQPAFEKLLAQREADGRWRLRYSYQGKTWANSEKKGAPSKLVTYRALKILY